MEVCLSTPVSKRAFAWPLTPNAAYGRNQTAGKPARYAT